MNSPRVNFDRPIRRSITDYFKRLWHYSHMDFEYAIWLMVNLWKDPFRVHNIYTKYRKQTKNQWARDDPAFVVIFLFFIIMSNIAWCFALYSSFTTLLLRVVSSIFIDFILVSILISTITWAYANKFLVSSNQDRDYPPFDQEQKVEWLYAFDIHCNSYFTMFLYTHIISFLLIPLYFYKRESILVTLISNILLGLAISLYFYTTSHGFTALPFLRKTQSFLYPAGALVAMILVATILNFNVSGAIINILY